MSSVHAWPKEEPELEELDKVDTKPILDIESNSKPASDGESDVIAPASLKCTVDGCVFKTGDLKQTVAATVLGIHSKANHVGRGTPSGRSDKLQSWAIQF